MRKIDWGKWVNIAVIVVITAGMAFGLFFAYALLEVMGAGGM